MLSIALKMTVSSVIGVMVSITCTYLTAKLSSKLGASIREKLYTHIQGFTLEEQKAYGPAALATRGSGDVANVQQVLVMLIQMILPGPFIGIVAVIMTWSVSRELAFIVALTILLFFGTVIFVFWKSLDNMKAIQERIDRMVAKLREVFVGVKIIRAFDNSAYEEERTNDTFVAHAENIIAINRRFALISPSAFLFLGFVMAAILWFGFFEVTTGAVKIGAVTAMIEYVTLALLQLLSGALVTVMIPRAVASLTRVVQAYLQYVSQVSEPVTQFSFVVNYLQAALAAVDRVYEALDAEEETEEPARPAVLEAPKGEIEFRHVSFGYLPGKTLMKDVSFTAKANQTIAVIGPTGAGKTTLVNLLMRFYEVNGGQILFDGKSTRDMTRQYLRSLLGMVLQDTWLFRGTVAENIAYGKRDAAREEIVEAVQCDSFIRTLPDGYDTVISSEQSVLSQGQQQLLTIARAALANPNVMILDEATSSIDTITEQRIQKALPELMKNRTSFIIAHRLSTIRNADLILVMRDGDIIETGTHEELLSRDSFYSRLYRAK